MSWVEITAIIVAIIGAVGGVIGAAVPYLLRRQAARIHAGVVAGMEATRNVYRILREVVDECGCERVILFAGHNSGGIPRPHSPFYVTALHWALIHESYSAAVKDYQNLPVDAWYIGMLLEAERNGVVELDPETMPPCQLRDYYRMEGVTHALVLFVAITENKFLYVSAAKYGERISEADKTRISLKVAKMREYCIPR